MLLQRQLDGIMPRGPGQAGVSLDVHHGRSDFREPRQDVLQAHAHDHVLWLRQRSRIHGHPQPAQELSFVLQQIVSRLELWLRCDDGGGVKANPAQPVRPLVLEDDVPQFVLHAGIRRGSDQPNFLLKLLTSGYPRAESISPNEAAFLPL
jgi:hypothetical protein